MPTAADVGAIGGSGSQWYLPIFTGATTLGNSLISYESGSGYWEFNGLHGFRLEINTDPYLSAHDYGTHSGEIVVKNGLRSTGGGHLGHASYKWADIYQSGTLYNGTGTLANGHASADLQGNSIGDGATWSVAKFTNGQAVQTQAATPANIGIGSAGATNGSSVATAGGYDPVTLSSALVSVTASTTIIATSTASATSNTGGTANCGLYLYVDTTVIGPTYGVFGGTSSSQPRTALAITGAQGSLTAGLHTVYTKLVSGQEGTVCTVGANESYMTIQLL
jgi:hypothetical protein